MKNIDSVRNMQLRNDSGNINSDDLLVDFLYTLMRDHLPTGVVEELVRIAEADAKATQTEHAEYTNGWLALYAINLSERLKAKAK